MFSCYSKKYLTKQEIENTLIMAPKVKLSRVMKKF